MVERIIAAIDYSDLSASVVEAAITLAQSTGSRLKLLHVLTPTEEERELSLEQALRGWHGLPGDLEGEPLSTGIREDILTAYQHHLAHQYGDRQDHMRPYLKQCEEAGVQAELVLIPGVPGPIICEYARMLNCLAIVIGRRGRTGLEELILGSVSSHVMHRANCPVLIVNPIPCPRITPTLTSA